MECNVANTTRFEGFFGSFSLFSQAFTTAHIQQILGLSYNYVGSFSPSERQMQTMLTSKTWRFTFFSLQRVFTLLLGQMNISGHSVNVAHSNVQNGYLVQSFVSTSSSVKDVFLKRKAAKVDLSL